VQPSSPVDDYAPDWPDFASLLAARSDDTAIYLVELHHERSTRTEWTVAGWRDRVRAVAGWLSKEGVAAGDAVATLAGNTADALALAKACWLLGACCVPLNPGDSRERQAFILRNASARLLVHADEQCDVAHALTESVGVALRSTAELPQAPSDDPPTSSGDLDGPALRVYTSGTTGEPKAVVLSLRNLLTDCDALATALSWDSSTRVITVLPIHHVNGLVVSSLLPWFAGMSTVLCDRFRSDRLWVDAEAEGANVCSVVPSLLEFLLAASGDRPGAFREILCGAGPLLPETVLDFEQRFSLPVRHLYGLSETTAVVTLMPTFADEDRRRWHRDYGFPSVGPAVPHAEVAVLNDSGVPVGPGVRGELTARGAMVMAGYAGQEEETAAAFRDGWFHTGDEGFWESGPDGRSYFFITGRIKELIIRGGANISPFEVDAVLHSHPAVRFGLAIPFENRFYGEEIAAYVVCDGDVSAEEILAHSARYLDHARCPKVVVFGDDVPYTATGKAKRLELKARLAPLLAEYRDSQFRRSRPGDAADAPGIRTTS
jgi:long-chain acyl-CoA synthetase